MSAQFDQFKKLQSETAASKTVPPRKKTKAAATKSTARTNSGKSTDDEFDSVDEKVKLFHSKGHDLEQQIRNAELETDQLQDELKQLDQAWAQKIAALSEAAPKTVEKRAKSKSTKKKIAGEDDPSNGRSRQNVISLAARIRALQKQSAEK